jgi:unsaturated rhamnogalacturonyl hydrolase
MLSYQDDDGLWHQLIDYKQSYKETSCTAMFTYAFVQGVKRGWLSEDEYGLAVRNSWLALADRVDEHGQLEGVCAETLPRDSLEYYLTRPKEKGNVYGQVAMLWCIVALL